MRGRWGQTPKGREKSFCPQIGEDFRRLNVVGPRVMQEEEDWPQKAQEPQERGKVVAADRVGSVVTLFGAVLDPAFQFVGVVGIEQEIAAGMIGIC
jgi:hypothetical protein